MRRILVLGPMLLIALAACLGGDPEDDLTDADMGITEGALLRLETEATCLDAGGRWARGGLSLDPLCFTRTPDAGQSCEKASDCAGACMAETRSCAAEVPMFGCYAFLDETGVEVEICVD